MCDIWGSNPNIMFFKKIKRGDAAVEWRWARDFEQTRVCVSEAPPPPPPRLLGARGAQREKEAAAPPALHLITFLAGEDHGGGAS